MGWRGIAAATVVALGLSGGVAYGAGQVGDPPTDDWGLCDRSLRPCSDPLILASGEHFTGSVEVVGFHSRLGICLAVETLERNGISGYSSCGGPALPRKGRAIAIDALGQQNSKHVRSAQISGTLRPDVASVRIRYRRKGNPMGTKPVFNQIDGELLGRLKESKPFGVFEATMRGCVKPHRIRAIAFDAAGEPLGQDRWPFVGRCPGPRTGVVTVQRADSRPGFSSVAPGG